MQMTKEQANSLIERLAEKKPECSWTCIECEEHGPEKCKYHYAMEQPIMLTDVLEKIENFHTEPEKAPEHIGCLMDTDDACCDLMRLWWNLGFTRSLQDILNEAETEHLCRCIRPGHDTLKGPAAELFSYLETLFPNENKKHDS